MFLGSPSRRIGGLTRILRLWQRRHASRARGFFRLAVRCRSLRCVLDVGSFGGISVVLLSVLGRRGRGAGLVQVSWVIMDKRWDARDEEASRELQERGNADGIFPRLSQANASVVFMIQG